MKRIVTLVLVALFIVAIPLGCAKPAPATPAPAATPKAPIQPAAPAKPAPAAEAAKPAAPSAPAAPGPKELISIKWMPTAPGTGTYGVSVAVSHLVNKYSDRVRIAVIPGKGTTDATRLIIEGGKIDVGLTNTLLAPDAYAGEDVYAKIGPQKQLRSMFPNHVGGFHIWVLKDSPIKTVYDLKGKRVTVLGPEASGAIFRVDLLKAAGLDPNKDVKLYVTAPGVENDALRDGLVDASLNTTAMLAATHMELATLKDVRLIPIPEEVTKKQQAMYKPGVLVPFVIPGGTYRGNPDDVPTHGTAVFWLTTTAFPADIAYEIAKITFEHLEEGIKINPGVAVLTPKFVTQYLGVPAHDGATKYFKEKGWIK